MTTFHEQTQRGDAFGALASAASFSALWAIGAAWSTAIRAISLELFPHASLDVVFAELVAALITTGVGISIALLLARSCRLCRSNSVTSPPPNPVSDRLQTIAARR